VTCREIARSPISANRMRSVRLVLFTRGCSSSSARIHNHAAREASSHSNRSRRWKFKVVRCSWLGRDPRRRQACAGVDREGWLRRPPFERFWGSPRIRRAASHYEGRLPFPCLLALKHQSIIAFVQSPARTRGMKEHPSDRSAEQAHLLRTALNNWCEEAHHTR